MEHDVLFPTEFDQPLENLTDIPHIQSVLTFIFLLLPAPSLGTFEIHHIYSFFCNFTGDLFTFFQILNFPLENIQVKRRIM